MNLTDFLLARIAEDAANADLVRRSDRAERLRIYGDQASGEVVMAPSRMLAECESKRGIVEWHDAGESECGDCWWGEGDCKTMRLLALPYADHPAYREEWKP